MAKARLILGMTLVALAGGIAVFAAQQPLAVFAAHHEGCTADGAAAGTPGKPHVPAHFARALELTTAQQADIERISAELCQAITKGHQGMMNVLTPEQRAKIAEVHGRDHAASGFHALMKKLHGGGK